MRIANCEHSPQIQSVVFVIFISGARTHIKMVFVKFFSFQLVVFEMFLLISIYLIKWAFTSRHKSCTKFYTIHRANKFTLSDFIKLFRKRAFEKDNKKATRQQKFETPQRRTSTSKMCCLKMGLFSFFCPILHHFLVLVLFCSVHFVETIERTNNAIRFLLSF